MAALPAVQAKDVDLLVEQTGHSRAVARRSLVAHEGDLVDALMHLHGLTPPASSEDGSVDGESKYPEPSSAPAATLAATPAAASSTCLSRASPPTTPTSSARRHVKIVLLGGAGVGKSTFLRRWKGVGFDADQQATIGVEFQSRTIRVTPAAAENPEDGDAVLAPKQQLHNCRVQVWDTAGQNHFKAAMPVFFDRAEGAICLYDVTSTKSFEQAKTWVAEYLSTLSAAAAAPPRVVLIGNKLDLVQPTASTSEGLSDGSSGGDNKARGGGAGISAANPNDGTMAQAVAVGTPIGDGSTTSGGSSNAGDDEEGENKRNVTRALAQAYADELDGCVRFLEISLMDIEDGGDGSYGVEDGPVSQIVEGLVAQVLRSDPDRPPAAVLPSFDSVAVMAGGSGAAVSTKTAASTDKERLLDADGAGAQVGSTEAIEDLAQRTSLGPQQAHQCSSPMQRFVRKVCSCLSPKAKAAP